MARTHHYLLTTTWTGNLGSGTSGYRSYSRNHKINSAGWATPLSLSSDPVFRGDNTRTSPEQLLLASLSSCHMLWVLHLCADSGIVVTAYEDNAEGVMQENEDGSGNFTGVVLRPRVQITEGGRSGELDEIHHKAHELCFISRSVNFPVQWEPVVLHGTAA